MIVFPNCKINLGLRILQKRSDGFHDLETVFLPITLHDVVEIIEAPAFGDDIDFTSSGVEVDGDGANNICLKAYRLLKNDFPALPPIKLHLHKAIPIGAGLGGGSADGAFTLLALNKKFNLHLNKEQLIRYALQLGSDCPFFITNTPCYATGRGELLEEIKLDLSAWQFMIVNPRIAINTGWAFSQLKMAGSSPILKESIQRPVEQWKDHLTNDFEEAIFLHYPEIKNCKETLYQSGATYAAMTGSGATVYGLFPKQSVITNPFPPHYFVKIL